MRVRICAFLLFLVLSVVTQTHGQSLSILTWNVESDGADPATIAKQLSDLSGHQIYALTEVDKREFDRFRSALGDPFKSINGTHKENDHLQLIYDSSRLDLIRWTEIEEFGGIKFNRQDRALRCPLLARFKDKSDQNEFQIVVNHLARGNANFRTQQAKGLREWARNQTIPTIAIGDFNFDFEFASRKGNEAFVEFMRDNVWMWVEPNPLVDTNWYDGDRDGADDYPGSMLDFAFVAGPAKKYKCTCKVVVRPNDFPDDNQTSDHRPVVLQISR